jgi:uncharacterized cofD-like protein
VVGQEAVALATGVIADVRLLPADPPTVPEVVDAIARADYVVLGPGSWYSSVIPHVLVPELLTAITQSRAQRILTMNLVPTEDETPAYTASRHIEVLADHAPGLRLDVVVADPTFADDDPHLAAYVASMGARCGCGTARPVTTRTSSPLSMPGSWVCRLRPVLPPPRPERWRPRWR